MTALKWLELQFETLYVSDDLGRLRFIREPGYEESELDAAPRFWMDRSKQGNIWRFRNDLPADVMLELDGLCRAESVVANWQVEARQAVAIRTVLERHAPITAEERGPAYTIPETANATLNTVIVTEANAAVLEQHFAWKLTSRNSFRSSLLAATVVDGDAVAICYCLRPPDFEGCRSGRGDRRAGSRPRLRGGGVGGSDSRHWSRASVQHVLAEYGVAARGAKN